MSEHHHASDCAIFNAPALEPGPCDCANECAFPECDCINEEDCKVATLNATPAASSADEGVKYRTFRDWFDENEGWSLRSERSPFQSEDEVDWLEAAFEAARATSSGSFPATEKASVSFLYDAAQETIVQPDAGALGSAETSAHPVHTDNGSHIHAPRPSSGAPSREAIARVIDPFPWDRRDLGMVGRGDEASIDRSLKIADAIRALWEEQNADR